MFGSPWLNIAYIILVLLVAYKLLFGGDYFDGPGNGPCKP